MTSHETKVQKFRVNAQNTRRNLPHQSARKRGESNFLRAFERAYFARARTMGLAASEFALSGYGVADLVWIGWSASSSDYEFSALSLEKQLFRRQLFAFEAKLKDWQKALRQAFRYRYFADKAIVVLPAANAGLAVANLEAFQHLGVGLWGFDSTSESIREHFTPTKFRALSDSARRKAISIISSKVNLGKLREKIDAAS